MARTRIRILLAALACVLSGAPASAQEAQPAWKMKPALVVMDLQNEFMPAMSEQDRRTAPRNINLAMKFFRHFGLPVVRVYHTDPGSGPAPDSKGFEFDSAIEVRTEDPKVVKNFPNAFKKTELEKLLRDKGVNTLFLCGLSGSGCLLATYHGADDLGFNTLLVKDTVLSPKSAHTEVVQEICSTISLEVLALMLSGLGK